MSFERIALKKNKKKRKAAAAAAAATTTTHSTTVFELQIRKDEYAQMKLKKYCLHTEIYERVEGVFI